MTEGRLKNYVLHYFIGGPADGERIPDEAIAGNRARRGMLAVGDERYLRVVAYCWGLQNLVYWVWADWDYREQHHSYAMQKMFDTHPDVREATKDELYGSKKL